MLNSQYDKDHEFSFEEFTDVMVNLADRTKANCFKSESPISVTNQSSSVIMVPKQSSSVAILSDSFS